MRTVIRSSLDVAVLVMAFSACSSNSTSSSVDTNPTTSAVPSTNTAASSITNASTANPEAGCPSVTFENLPAPWDPTVRAEQGGGSGLPGTHIERSGAFINLFPGGSIWTPSAPVSITVDGHSGQIGTVEDGLSVRVTLTGQCDTFDFVAYGVPDDELRTVMAAVRFD